MAITGVTKSASRKQAATDRHQSCAAALFHPGGRSQVDNRRRRTSSAPPDAANGSAGERLLELREVAVRVRKVRPRTDAKQHGHRREEIREQKRQHDRNRPRRMVPDVAEVQPERHWSHRVRPRKQVQRHIRKMTMAVPPGQKQTSNSRGEDR